MPEESKTGSRLYCAKEKIKNKFILLYCDNYSSLNIHKLNSEFDNSKTNILFSLVKKKMVIVNLMKEQIKFSIKKKEQKK